MNFFEVLEIQPVQLALDPKHLETDFYRLSRASHPDHSGTDPDTLEKSAQLNGAYRTLRDPWSRARYLLDILRIPLSSKIPACLGPIYIEIQESMDQSELERLKRQLASLKRQRLQQLEDQYRKFDQLKISSLIEGAPKEAELILNKIQELVGENNYANSMERNVDQRLEK